jgi:hemerythrin-like domain-containing protein
MSQKTIAQLCDTSDMVLVHRVFRREFRLLPAMVRSVPLGDSRRAAFIADHAELIADALHEHHSNEDLLLWPKLAARASWDSDLVTRMETQHETLAKPLAELKALVQRWRESPEPAASEPLEQALRRVSQGLEEHLADEEEHVLPVAAQHITQPEWDELRKRGVAALPKSVRLMFLGFILEEATDSERAKMLGRSPLPVRAAYRLLGERMWRRRTATLRLHL